MELKKLNETNGKLVFLIKDTEYEFVNSMRRIIFTEVPILAVKQIAIKKNNSNLFDEVIANRIGLIPLITDLDTYELPEKCNCKGAGCAKCQLKFHLKVVGPKIVYSEDLVIDDPKIKSSVPNIPIVKLMDEQELDIEGTITLGSGKEHSKYIPAHVYYMGVPKIKIDVVKDPKSIQDSCPTGVFEIVDKKLKVKNIDKCILCQKCAEISEGKIEVTASEKEFIFTIESWGQLSAKKILKETVNILNEKLSALETEIKK